MENEGSFKRPAKSTEEAAGQAEALQSSALALARGMSKFVAKSIFGHQVFGKHDFRSVLKVSVYQRRRKTCRYSCSVVVDSHPILRLAAVGSRHNQSLHFG